MRTTFFFLLTLCCLVSFGQTFISNPSLPIRYFDKDSVKIFFNSEYFLVDDSCATIIRYGRVNEEKGYFVGNFRDVLAQHPSITVVKGSYAQEGYKQDSFCLYYPNGSMMAKGNFRLNKLYGRWECFYEDGRPKVIFYAVDGYVMILEAWDEKGKKTVENGNGTYLFSSTVLKWTGKIKNGRPDGKWIAVDKTGRNNIIFATEHFKEGAFKNGKAVLGDYSFSQIVFASEKDFAFVNAEYFKPSSTPCNYSPQTFENAVYSDGFETLSEKIKSLVTPYLEKVDLRDYDRELELTGEISEKGYIHFENKSLFNDKIASGLIRALLNIPPLQPALLNGAPIQQGIVIKFSFSKGFYSFSYHLLSLKENK